MKVIRWPLMLAALGAFFLDWPANLSLVLLLSFIEIRYRETFPHDVFSFSGVIRTILLFSLPIAVFRAFGNPYGRVIVSWHGIVTLTSESMTNALSTVFRAWVILQSLAMMRLSGPIARLKHPWAARLSKAMLLFPELYRMLSPRKGKAKEKRPTRWADRLDELYLECVARNSSHDTDENRPVA